ncbi:hypothetical protein C8R45DRAFT_1183795 [Mycena sanguinolenta]|nr:hypothetical protein C8R45DRAFT_1183795 [Mycena sanguinolenta]
MSELEALLARLPGAVLDVFRDEAWLRANHLFLYLSEQGSSERIGTSSSRPSFLNQPPYGLDISSFFQDPGAYPCPIDFSRMGSSTPSSGYSFSEFEDIYPSEFSYPASSTSSSEFYWYAPSQTSHSSPASEFAMFDEMAPPTVYSATDTDLDHSLDSMLSVFEASLDLLESQPQTPLDNYFASLVLNLPISDPGLISGSPPFLPAVGQSNLDVPLMTPAEIDSAGEEWPWVPSGTIWLDDDVSSDVYIPAEPFPVTQNCNVEHVERVHSVPSQMPVSRVPTAYIIDFKSARDTHKDKDKDGNTMNLELILKDHDCHSWDGTPGERQLGRAPSVNVQLFASYGVFDKVLCRRARQKCQGLYACDCIDPLLLDVESHELDPHARDAINSAQVSQRLTQGTVIQDKAICFVNTVKKMKCTGKDSAAKPCDGYQVLKNATKDLCVHFFRGESMDAACAEKTEGMSTCSRVIGSGSGKKGKQQCPFPHLKDSKVHVAQMEKHTCRAASTIYVPFEEDTIHIAIVVPKHEFPHTHPPPSPTKVPADVKHLYEQAIRAFRVLMATVNKVEHAATTIQIMGKAPGLVHPLLLQVATKQGIITALKRHKPGGDKHLPCI